ncbi:ARMS [Mytilus edulis]|uniref:KIDINS220 n=1 Tax=Mytilus edulis TaxID=6550 RepID=A0A8S3QYU9_MYTED|nr:ARMS [Mytilus edulis]
MTKVDQCSDSGVTGQIMSSQEGYFGKVKLLFEKNPNVNICDKNNISPLLWGIQGRHNDIEKLLLERNLDPFDNTSPSTSYVNNNISISYSPSLVQPLIRHKPDINAQTYDGGNALYFSARNGNIEITQLLLENNADCNICTYSKQFQTDAIIDYPVITLEQEKKDFFDYHIKNASSYVAEYVSKQS